MNIHNIQTISYQVVLTLNRNDIFDLIESIGECSAEIDNWRSNPTQLLELQNYLKGLREQ